MMNNKKNVPDIRFKGFNFGWKSKRFDKTFSMLSNNTLSRADLNYEKGSTKNVHYGDILIRFGECTNVARENIPYISDDKVADKYISSRLQDGDIVFADTAEDATAGKCSEFFNIQEQPIISGLHTIPCHPLLPFSIGYLGYFLNSPSYHNQLLPLMQGTKVVGISKTAIKETNISFPEDVDEQQAIGNYFQNIDRLINTSQTKLDKLKNIKKACLEKMFPRNGSTTPELRFKGFTEEWIIKKFGTCVLIQRGGSPRPIEEFITDDENGINWIKIGDVSTGSRYITSTNEKIKPEGESKSRRVEKGDLILSNSMSFGRPYIMQIDGCIHDGWLLIRNDKGIFDLEYLLQMLSSDYMLTQYKSLASGGVVNNLNSELVQSTTVQIANVNEQIRIGFYFKNLDDLIAKTEQQINKLKNIKKACLDKMFVQI